MGLRLWTVGPLIKPDDLAQLFREAEHSGAEYSSLVRSALGRQTHRELHLVCRCTENRELPTIEDSAAEYFSTLAGIPASKLRAKVVIADKNQLNLF